MIADAREPDAAAQLLASCNWDVEQALQLHWATAGDAAEGSGAPAASSSMSAPLLARGAGGAGGSGGFAAKADRDGTQAEGKNDDDAGRTQLRKMDWARAGAAQAQILLFCDGLEAPAKA